MRCFRGYRSGRKRKRNFLEELKCMNVSNIVFPLRGERKSKIYRKVSISIADCHGFILVGKLVEKRIENSNDTFFVHFSLRPVRKSVVKRAVTIERALRKEKQYFRNLYNFPRFETIESRFTSVISETGYETYLHSPGTEHVFLTLSLSLFLVCLTSPICNKWYIAYYTQHRVRLRDKENQYYPILITTFESWRKRKGFFRSKHGIRPTAIHLSRGEMILNERSVSPEERRIERSNKFRLHRGPHESFVFLSTRVKTLRARIAIPHARNTSTFFLAAFIPRENECDRRSVGDKRTRRVMRRPLSFRAERRFERRLTCAKRLDSSVERVQVRNSHRAAG